MTAERKLAGSPPQRPRGATAMSSPEPDFGYYSGEWSGTLDEEGFARALPRAVSAVRGRVWPNDPERAPEAYRRAVCAAVDVDAAWGLGGGVGALSSVTAGTVSMSFGAGGATYEADLAHAVDAELAGSGLLFAGVGR